ncbi:hypothetical protein MKZ38_007407 [Zalerion maritima]|uniref:Uncharacterized protein n=1 Tax=Zalerion maritima TaxID=339359 RepID=A0AAD5S2Z0_9PEZI|nr:hypothetical protein MKZ38_007407 [Zalerion maritima]
MGRTSKFTFPVPGRRAKATPPPPMPAGPVSKANKILGTSDINTGLPPPRTAWDANSVSGISVTLSETTCNYSDARLLDDSGEDEDYVPEMKGGVDETSQWEQESEIIPRGFQQPEVNVVDTSDMSTIRRKRMSTSTITSFYDKPKMPLAISQQTSSSAIAKGLPIVRRAPSLADDGSSVGSKKKKKPARLDLSYLLPSRNRSSKSLVLGPDMVTKSPSVMSFSTEATPPPKQERRVTKRATMESLRGKSIAEEPMVELQPRGTTDVRGLHNLYNHYEQMTFRSILGDGIEEVESPLFPEHHQKEKQRRKSSLEGVPVVIRQPHHEPQLDPMREVEHEGQGSTRTLEVPNSPGIVGGDCSASISSKYTRTSKASKRTNQSMVESDLNEKSILSLSDDSEDEQTTPAGGSAPTIEPAPLSSSLAVPERANPTLSLAESHQRPNSQGQIVKGRRRLSSPGQPARFSRAASHHLLSPPPSTPPTACLPEPPRHTTQRASAMPVMSTSKKPERSSSKASAKTSSSQGSKRVRQSRTIQSPNSPEQRIQRSNTTSIDECRRLSTPARNNRQSACPNLQTTNTKSSIFPHHLPQFNMPLSPQSRRLRHRVSQRSSSGQPTPPMSPSSIDSAARPGSINARASSRFMAVTKQEEMLLSALRNKRKHMRETLLAEFQGRESIDGCLGHKRDLSNTSSFGPLDSPTSPTGRRRLSVSGLSSSSSATMDAINEMQQHHRRRRSSLAGPPSHLTFATTAASDPTTMGPTTPDAGASPIYKQEYYFSASVPTSDKRMRHPSAPNGKPSPSTQFKGYSIPAPQALSFISPVRSGSMSLETERHERVLLYLDRPIEEHEEEDVSACVYDGEPSPDLSDFIDFDNMSTGEPVTPISGRDKRSSQGSDQPGPKTVLPTSHLSQTHSQAVDEGPIPENDQAHMVEHGVPRPDSPISPVGFLSFPPATHQGHQNAIRISAVGPSGGGAPTSWWMEEDAITTC